ncbi:PREDICTED: chymotrypsin B-like [Acropora digitifera]|uniref:chymotrypsin B-like n=1 Tax=Acropora digitifera TaxID=70779 RepID=UPI00077A779B|nr:PREDICTED: chymotrypsin B-like [Acropora digitifera]
MTQYPGPAHNILQQAKLPPVSNEVCARKLAQSPGGDSLKITGEMICAGVEGEPLSGCHGDSGRPYVCQASSGNWFLQGAVSWGSPRCAASERYTVFARVTQFRNWIRQHTGV